MLPYASHEVSMPVDKINSQQGDLDCFRFWLQGYEDPTSDKRDQYRRWEGLCDMQVAEHTGRPAFCVPSAH
jgi:hypothetical protein